jgi:non-heme chloroperoxidase
LTLRGPRRISRAALLAPLPPFLPRAQGNPRGIDRRAFDKFTRDLLAGRPAAVKAFVDSCYNLDQFGGTRVSDQAWQNAFYAAVGTALPAAVGCVAAGQEDFRADLTQISVPILVMQAAQTECCRRGRPAAGCRHCSAMPATF